MNRIDMRTAPPRHLWKTWQPRSEPITHVVIHHSATPPTQSIHSMAWYHVNTKDMPSIQYHYVVTHDGQVCWMNDDDLLVWHGHGSNEWGIGVCLVGDFTHEHPPEVQLAAARELIAHLETKHGRRLEVIGHKEAPRAATACPGDTWDDWKEELVVNAVQDGAYPRILVATQSEQYPDWLVDVAERLGGWQPINPWRGAWQKFTERGIPTFGRPVFPDDSDKALIKLGKVGAERWWREYGEPVIRLCPDIIDWSGPNEETVWNQTDGCAQDAFFSRLADIYHDNGKRLLAYRKSTHHWDFPYWDFFGESLSKVDYLASNHYELGPRFDLTDTNGLMRLVTDVAAIRSYGYRVPPCIVTEWGYDSDPRETGGHRGWRTRGIDRNTYTTEFVQGMLRLGSQVPELRYVSGFISQVEDPQWGTFELDRGDLEMLADKAEASYVAAPVPAEPPVAQIVAETQRHIIPRTPGWALYEAGKARGYYEASGEFDVGEWRCQAFRDPYAPGLQIIAYCPIGDWEDIHFAMVNNETHELVA